MSISPSLPPLQVYLLGVVPFPDIQQLQRRFAYELGEGQTIGHVILCEHPATISIGRHGSRAHIGVDDEQLDQYGIRLHWTNRGGGCVLHLAGQLSVYVTLPLDRLGLSLGGYLDRLHRTIVDVLAQFDLKGRTWPEATGVFLNESRVASVGVAVNRWITAHGFVLNVGPYMGAFDLIDETGPAGRVLRHTSMEAWRQRPVPMHRVREAVIQRLIEHFGLGEFHLYTDHPLIRQKTISHVYASALG